jgi:hypothetical protein
VRSSSTHGDSSALTRVHSASRRGRSPADAIRPSRAASLRRPDRVLEVAEQDVGLSRDVGQLARPSSRSRSRRSGSSARA